MIQIKPLFRINKVSESGKAVHLKMTEDAQDDKFLYKWVSCAIMKSAGATNLNEGAGGTLHANLYNNANEDFQLDLYIEKVIQNAKTKARTPQKAKNNKTAPKEDFDDDIPF